jgi:hypothetical protein
MIAVLGQVVAKLRDCLGSEGPIGGLGIVLYDGMVSDA